MARQTSKLTLAIAALVLTAAPALAQDYDYLSRSDSISLSAGNAKAANIIIQTPTPWPWYVNKTHIHSSGARGADIIGNYESRFSAPQGSAPSQIINITSPNQ